MYGKRWKADAVAILEDGMLHILRRMHRWSAEEQVNEWLTVRGVSENNIQWMEIHTVYTAV